MSNQSSSTPPQASDDSQEHAERARKQRTYRFQVLRFVGLVILILLVFWGGSYFIAYTSDAYIDANVVSVAPEVTGRVDHVYVKDNQQVKKGDLLFSLDPAEFQIKVDSAQGAVDSKRAQLNVDRTNVESAQAELSSDQASLKLANRQLARAQTLVRQGAYARQQLDQQSATQQEAAGSVTSAQAAVNKARATLELDQTDLETAQSDLHHAQWELSRTRLYASQDGTITHLTLEKGDTASANTGVMAVVSHANWRVMANYKEYFVRHLAPGDTAWVWVDSYPWHLYKVKVQGVSHAISRSENAEGLVPYIDPTVDWIRLSRRIPVRFTFVDLPPQVLAGSDVRVFAFY